MNPQNSDQDPVPEPAGGQRNQSPMKVCLGTTKEQSFRAPGVCLCVGSSAGGTG